MPLSALWRKLSAPAVEFFFPRSCIGCGKVGEFLCSSCRQSLPRLMPPWCPGCGHPLPVEPCAFCRSQRMEADGLRSVFRFEGLVRHAIHRFKYGNFKALRAPLSELMSQYLRDHPLPVEVVVPVPLHPHRLRERGYNQAELLAWGLGDGLGLPRSVLSLERRLSGPPQVRSRSRQERWQNVAGAFVVRGSELSGKRVLLVDDVCTTGATLNACAHALKAAGSAEVWGLTLAREI